jgi:hypothetical protein
MRTTFSVDFSLIVCLFAAAGLFDGLSPWFVGEREFLRKIPFFSTFSFQQTLCFDSCGFVGY